MVFRDCGDGEWDRASNARGGSARLFTRPDHFSSGWNSGRVALDKATSANQILGIRPAGDASGSRALPIGDGAAPKHVHSAVAIGRDPLAAFSPVSMQIVDALHGVFAPDAAV